MTTRPTTRAAALQDHGFLDEGRDLNNIVRMAETARDDDKPMPTMEPTASDGCDDDDDDDKRNEQASKAMVTTKTTRKAAALEDHRFLDECGPLDDIVHLAEKKRQATTAMKTMQATTASDDCDDDADDKHLEEVASPPSPWALTGIECKRQVR